RPWISSFLWIEVISIALFFLYLYLRSVHPAANNTEHFMDMALLSSSGKSHFFPFIDPWFSGHTVNYYYYGSYLLSIIANISSISYAMAYNFSLGLIYSLSAILAGAIAYAITKLKKIAFLAAFLTTTAGTLFYAACAIGGIFAEPNTICSYASSTRLFTPSYIINEIPSYSFTVGNLHAHLIALPFFLLGLFVLYAISQCDKPKYKDFLFLALLLATSGMINLWDFVTLSALVNILILIKIIKSRKFLLQWAGFGTISIIAAFLAMMPLLVYFKSPVLGIGFAPLYAARHNLINTQYPTPFSALVGMWGIFAVSIAVAFTAIYREIKNNIFFIIISVVALGIIVGMEFFFIKDIYSIANPPYFRANTTFKFGYHAWVLLSLASAVSLGALGNRKGTKIAVSTVALSALLAGIIYPIEAIRQYYLPANTPHTLDASSWMKNKNAGDLETIDYINKNIRERSVIAEAVGDSYTDFSRITTFTGMITPMGWKTHEWTWRFQGKEIKNAPLGTTIETGWGAVSIVANDIARLYTTPSPEEAKQIIDQYKIEYIYVGSLEQSQYPALEESKFYQLGNIIFESKGSKLFKVQ
ncbi:MAG: DUF2298 domain-containing protein, partial [Patescibacteria group bacterium]